MAERTVSTSDGGSLQRDSNPSFSLERVVATPDPARTCGALATPACHRDGGLRAYHHVQARQTAPNDHETRR
jgi:hypothetical protein